MGTDGFAIGKQTVDLRYLEQLIDSEQTACLGMLLKYAVETPGGRQTDNCRSRCTVAERTRNVRHAFLAETVSFPAVMPCRGCRRCIPVLTVIVYRKGKHRRDYERILVVVDMQTIYDRTAGQCRVCSSHSEGRGSDKTGVYDRIISPKTRTRVIIWIRRKESGCPSCTASKEPKAGRLHL